jgi:hypothetical protein
VIELTQKHDERIAATRNFGSKGNLRHKIISRQVKASVIELTRKHDETIAATRNFGSKGNLRHKDDNITTKR